MSKLLWALTHNVPHSVVRIVGDVASIGTLGLYNPSWADRYSDWRFCRAVNKDLKKAGEGMAEDAWQTAMDRDVFDYDANDLNDTPLHDFLAAGKEMTPIGESGHYSPSRMCPHLTCVDARERVAEKKVQVQVEQYESDFSAL